MIIERARIKVATQENSDRKLKDALSNKDYYISREIRSLKLF